MRWGSNSNPAAPARGDSLRLRLSLFKLMPSALAFDRRWTSGIPSRWPDVGAYLQEHTGHDFPVLKQITHGRAVRAIATLLRDNCSATESRVGMDVKCRAGLVYAGVVEDERLARAVTTLGQRAGIGELEKAARMAVTPIDFDDAAAVAQAVVAHGPAMVLAGAAAYSPARNTRHVVEATRSLPPDGVVELITWLAVLQLMHRLHCFYAA